jgi:hypothetical protein
MERDCMDCPAADEGERCSARWPLPYHVCVEHRARKVAERAAILAKIKVRTEHVYPPIPVREWDWSAVDDNTYDGPGNPIGWGRTEQAAIDDLVEQLIEAQ